MQEFESSGKMPLKKLKPEMKIQGQFTVLTYNVASFLALTVALDQVYALLKKTSGGHEFFLTKRESQVKAERNPGEGSGISMSFLLPLQRSQKPGDSSQP